MRYRAYKDEVRLLNIQLPDVCKITFHLPMPAGWSEKKKLKHVGQPHRSKPDVDNLAKGLLDALYSKDEHVWSIWTEKRWSETGAIEVLEIGDNRSLLCDLSPSYHTM